LILGGFRVSFFC